jgi:hypothetical protein
LVRHDHASTDHASMSGSGRIPVWTADTAPRAGRIGMVLVLTGPRPDDAVLPGYAAIRHAAAAAITQAGGCDCCRVPSDLVTLLRQLFIERVRGEIQFDGVVIVGPAGIAEQAMTDPLVAARYEVSRPNRL